MCNPLALLDSERGCWLSHKTSIMLKTSFVSLLFLYVAVNTVQLQTLGPDVTDSIPSNTTSSGSEVQPDPTLTSSDNLSPSPLDNGDGIGDDDTDNRIPLYLSAYFTLGGNWDGSGILPAVEMALDHINENPDVLQGYQLKMIWNDTRCDAGLGTRMLFDQLYTKPQKIMILGPACSTAAQSVAETAYHWNLVTMSYSAASSALSDREKYPYFYRTYMPDAAVNPARVRLMKDFNWNRVATIHYNHELFSLAIDDLLTLLNEANITIITSESFAASPKNQIANIKAQDAKIIVANMYENQARRVFCEAYKQGLTGDDYVWLLIGWYAHEWWAADDDYIDCTVEEMTEAVLSSMYISTEPLQLSTKTEPIVSGITPQEYVRLLEDRMTWPENQQYTWNGLNPFGYDAAWAIALMLNKSIEILDDMVFSDSKTRRLEDFTYDDEEMAALFFELLKETDFIGTTGPVSFRDGDRVGVTQVEQLQAGCDEDWHFYQGHCYRFVQDRLPMTQAEQGCQNLSAHLATISNQEEQAFVYGLWSNLTIPERPFKWLIGLRFDPSTRNYTWVLPVHTYSYVTWKPDGSDLPIIDRAGDCVYVDYTQGSAKWMAGQCTEQMPYICRKSGDFSEHRIALYTTQGDVLDWERNIIWRGGKVPLDHTPKVIITTIRVHQGIGLHLYLAMCILAGIGIVMALFFLGFNIKYRNQRFVKMSSPYLNNLIILGSICVYLGVLVGGVDGNLVSVEEHAIACQIRAWVFSVGFVLAFGSMFSKTWRVHRVAAFKTPKRRIITDNQLFVMVFVFFLIDICILTVWQIIDPLFVNIKDLYERDDPDVPNQRIVPYIEQCTSHDLIFWLVPLYSYKGLLLLFGTFLAWETRKVQIPALNDSKLIGICVYNVIVLCIVGVSVSFLISNNTSALFIFTSSIVIFCTTLTLIVVFVPKVISVHKYPDGEPVSAVGNRTNTFSSRDGNTSNLLEENKQLHSRIQVLEKDLESCHSNGSSNSNIPVKAVAGCGLWVGSTVCSASCCTSVPSEPADRYTVEANNEDKGKVNHAVDVEIT
ncbi:gamma-aminobutyric acid type B receptor subunit 2-like [Amphiura filiformis]|uniref:gamma-aminobutyric acid type B receptor subunit 2-like n=1 Tax=Amphiura filiformis TaxID=82378 RepID=UPI003B20BE4F